MDNTWLIYIILDNINIINKVKLEHKTRAPAAMIDIKFKQAPTHRQFISPLFSRVGQRS